MGVTPGLRSDLYKLVFREKWPRRFFMLFCWIIITFYLIHAETHQRQSLGDGGLSHENPALFAETAHDRGPAAHRLAAASQIRHRRPRPGAQTRAILCLHLKSREEAGIHYQRPHQAWHPIEDEEALHPEALALKAQSASC